VGLGILLFACRHSEPQAKNPGSKALLQRPKSFFGFGGRASKSGFFAYGSE